MQAAVCVRHMQLLKCEPLKTAASEQQGPGCSTAQSVHVDSQS